MKSKSLPEKYFSSAYLRAIMIDKGRLITALPATGRRIMDDLRTKKLQPVLQAAVEENPWFTFDQTSYRLASICNHYLDKDKLDRWLLRYNRDVSVAKTVGITMAGNIPLAGFHDLLCVLASGHKAMIKMSSKDKVLLPAILETLFTFWPEAKDNISFVSNKFSGFDAMIATGSNNSARYFDYYFGKYPHIIRKNRNSVAVLSGNESRHELTALAEDIFRYFGMGCRSISKLYLPVGFEPEKIFESLEPWSDMINHYKYANNYMYNKGIWSVNGDKFLDNGFLLLKEDQALASPLSVLYYEFYQDKNALKNKIKDLLEEIQLVVGREEDFLYAIPFGTAQQPQLWDYADGIDTMEFLYNLD